MSAFAAGAMAASDAERGWWSSPSNYPIKGIVGTTRGVDFEMGEASSRANQLNAGNVATVIQLNGYRLWGNRGCGSDAEWQFISVRRTADVLNDSLLEAHLWAVDRCVGAEYVEQVVAGVNAALRDLKTQGAILGGRCWADPDLNTAASIQGGRVYFDFDFTPCYPAERITFRSALTGAYLEEIFA